MKSKMIELVCGQVVMAAIYGNLSGRHHPDGKAVLDLAKKSRLGGVAIFGGNARGCRDLLSALQTGRKDPLLVGMDMERGVGQHFLDATIVPYALARTATRSDRAVKDCAQVVAREARAVGINTIFGPVLDVNVNPDNPIISVRSYGDTVKHVLHYGKIVHDIYEAEGLLPVIKHFPGHGDTAVDSHRAMPTIKKSLGELKRTELAPFKALIDHGARSIMIGHLAVPALEKKGTPLLPATFSSAIIRDFLRRQMEFEGLVMTDALIMDAVSRGRDELEAARLCLLAGNDVLLYPRRPDRLVERLISLAKRDKELRLAVEEAAERVHTARKSLPKKLPSFSIVGSASHRQTAARVQEQAVTLLRGSLKPIKTAKTVTLFTAGPGGIQPPFKTGWKIIAPLEDKKIYAEIHPLENHKKVTLGNVAITACYHAVAGWGERQRLTPSEIRAIKMIAKKRPTIVVIFGTPYSARDLSKIPNITILLAYDCTPQAEKAVGWILARGERPMGCLPVKKTF